MSGRAACLSLARQVLASLADDGPRFRLYGSRIISVRLPHLAHKHIHTQDYHRLRLCANDSTSSGGKVLIHIYALTRARALTAVHKPTVEELHSNAYNIAEFGEIYLEILDTSGTFEFPAMRRLSIQKGDAFILVYSVTDAASWQEVCHLRQLILDEKHGSDWPQAYAQQAQKPPERPPRGHRKAASPIADAAAAAAASSDSPRSSTELDKPISSVYAAAARLASISRRTSSSPALKPSKRSDGGAETGTTTDKPQQQQHKPIAHYHSQLSKLLADSSLQQSISIDDDDNDDDGENDDEYLRSKHTNGKVARKAAQAAKDASSSATSSARTSSGSEGPLAAKLAGANSAPGLARTPIVVVANKCDLDASAVQVNQDEVERIVRDEWVSVQRVCSVSLLSRER